MTTITDRKHKHLTWVRALDCMPDLADAPATFGKQMFDWETCCDALLKQQGESLADAAHRALRRSRRFGRVTVRTQVAGIIVGGAKRDPWPSIERAAALWRRQP